MSHLNTQRVQFSTYMIRQRHTNMHTCALRPKQMHPLICTQRCLLGDTSFISATSLTRRMGCLHGYWQVQGDVDVKTTNHSLFWDVTGVNSVQGDHNATDWNTGVIAPEKQEIIQIAPGGCWYALPLWITFIIHVSRNMLIGVHRTKIKHATQLLINVKIYPIL